MSKTLKKGNILNLLTEIDDLSNLAIGLSWDDSHQSGKLRDLDMSAFMVAEDTKVPAESFFVYYNNLSSADRSLLHKGDNRTGQGEGDDEVIWMNLTQVTSEIEAIYLVASIHSSEETVDTFGEINQMKLRMYDRNSTLEVAQYMVDKEHTEHNAIVLGRFYREYGLWYFEAMSEGTSEGLVKYVDQYA